MSEEEGPTVAPQLATLSTAAAPKSTSPGPKLPCSGWEVPEGWQLAEQCASRGPWSGGLGKRSMGETHRFPPAWEDRREDSREDRRGEGEVGRRSRAGRLARERMRAELRLLGAMPTRPPVGATDPPAKASGHEAPQARRCHPPCPPDPGGHCGGGVPHSPLLSRGFLEGSSPACPSCSEWRRGKKKRSEIHMSWVFSTGLDCFSINESDQGARGST